MNCHLTKWILALLASVENKHNTIGQRTDYKVNVGQQKHARQLSISFNSFVALMTIHTGRTHFQ